MAYIDNYPLVGSSGEVYIAAYDTAAPAAWTTLDSAPWTKLGVISEDGVTWKMPEIESEDIMSWQSAFPVRTVTTKMSTSISFALVEWDRQTIPAALGGGTFADGTTLTTYTPPAVGSEIMRTLLVKIVDTPLTCALYYKRAKVTALEDVTFDKKSPALLGMTFSAIGVVGSDPYNLLFTKADFAP